MNAIKHRLLRRAGIGIYLCCSAAQVFAQQDTLAWSTFSMGASVSSGVNTSLASTAGQLFVGRAESDELRLESGFMAVLLNAGGGLAVDDVKTLPLNYALRQNYPNPFNPSTTLEFDLPNSVNVKLIVYDLRGQEVVRLIDQHLEGGIHRLVWNARDRTGRELPSGMYFVFMSTPEFSKSIKLVLLK